MIRRSAAPIVALAVLLAGCTGAQDAAFDLGLTDTSSVSVDYYPIQGNSIEALDTQIKRKGPRVAGNRHAVAVARISMQPKMSYRRGPNGCAVSDANVAVNARVTLPAWTGRAEADRRLGAQWDNIDRYTRLHEAVHVAIAFRHARALERRLVTMAPAPSCIAARRRAAKLARRALEAHDRSQQMFDRREQSRIAAMRRRGPRPDGDDFGEPHVPKGLGLKREAVQGA